MEENNEILEEKIKELHTVIEKSQGDLLEKFETYIEDDKYKKELETVRQLCQKMMDLYQLNKKEIESLEKKQEKLEEDRRRTNKAKNRNSKTRIRRTK